MGKGSSGGFSKALVGVAVLSSGASEAALRSSHLRHEERRLHPEAALEGKLAEARASDADLSLRAAEGAERDRSFARQVGAAVAGMVAIGGPAVAAPGLALLPLGGWGLAAGAAVAYGAWSLVGSLYDMEGRRSELAAGLSERRDAAASEVCSLPEAPPGSERIGAWKERRQAACEVAARAGRPGPSGM